MTSLTRFVLCVIANRDTKCEAGANGSFLVLVSVCLCKMFSLHVRRKDLLRDFNKADQTPKLLNNDYAVSGQLTQLNLDASIINFNA